MRGRGRKTQEKGQKKKKKAEEIRRIRNHLATEVKRTVFHWQMRRWCNWGRWKKLLLDWAVGGPSNASWSLEVETEAGGQTAEKVMGQNRTELSFKTLSKEEDSELEVRREIQRKGRLFGLTCFSRVFTDPSYCCCLHAKSYLTLGDPMDYSPPGASVPGISQQKHWSGLPKTQGKEPIQREERYRQELGCGGQGSEESGGQPGV